jgi:hypothetical protein
LLRWNRSIKIGGECINSRKIITPFITKESLPFADRPGRFLLNFFENKKNRVSLHLLFETFWSNCTCRFKCMCNLVHRYLWLSKLLKTEVSASSF